MSKIKRLFFDIETSPNIGFFWKPGSKLNISYDNIIKERAIICICYKWSGDKKVYSLTWDKNQNDKKMLSEFIKILNEADEIVGHNGDRYDLPWVRTRCLFHNIPAFPYYTTLDTLKQSRAKFNFNSNRLDYIARFLGIGKKINTEFSLWKNIVLNKDEKALNKMVEYCKGDVVLLEQIYNKLSNYVSSTVHHGVLHGENRLSCPSCTSIELKKRGNFSTASGVIKIRLECKKCGKSHSMAQSTYEKLKNEN